MQAHVCKKKNFHARYLSPHHVSMHAILGPDTSDGHPDLAGLDGIAKVKKKTAFREIELLKAADYMYKCMKMIKGNGCILAAHRIG